MKKILALLSAAILIFGFVTVTIAQQVENRVTEPEAVQSDCPKCPLAAVPCPGTRTETGVQGNITIITDTVLPFDYDGKPYVVGGFGTSGYCTGSNYADSPLDERFRDCKFLIDVCKCGYCDFIQVGDKMGIEMYIKTPGVYWADPDNITENMVHADEVASRANKPTVFFDMFPEFDKFCIKTADGLPNYKKMEETPFYLENGKRIGGSIGADISGASVRNFGPVEYYTKFEEKNPNEHGQFETIVTHQYTNEEPLAGEHKGAVPARNRVVVLQSFTTTDYVFTEYDASVSAGCKVWIDIPSMRIDPTVAQAGDIIQVQVRLLFDRDAALESICPTCETGLFCDVTRDVAVVCCPDDGGPVVTGSEYCVFFPYVLQGLNNDTGGNWSTGIALSARNNEMPDDAWVELELRDQAGNVVTYKRENLGQGLVWSFVLDDIMERFTGGNLTAGATALKATSNYSMDGYQFLNVAGMFGAGSNAIVLKGDAPVLYNK